MTYLTRPRSAEVLSGILLAAGADFEFSEPSLDEIEPARAVAARLMNCEVAKAETIAAMRALQPASSLVRREHGEVTGVAAIVFLSPAGADALIRGAFDGLAPQRPFLACGAEPAWHCYYWAIAGATKASSAAAMELFRRVRFELFPDLAQLAVATTPIGRHVALTRLAMQPARGPDDNLMLGAPILAARAA